MHGALLTGANLEGPDLSGATVMQRHTCATMM